MAEMLGEEPSMPHSPITMTGPTWRIFAQIVALRQPRMLSLSFAMRSALLSKWTSECADQVRSLGMP